MPFNNFINLSQYQLMNESKFTHSQTYSPENYKLLNRGGFSSMISTHKFQKLNFQKSSMLPDSPKFAETKLSKQIKEQFTVKSAKTFLRYADLPQKEEKIVPLTPNAKAQKIKQFQSLLRHKSRQQKIYKPLKDMTFEAPKLRETNSTLCQSPKSKTQVYSRASQFKKIKLLDKGKYGNVFLVKHIFTGFIAALKVIRKIDLFTQNSQDNSKILAQLTSEIKLQAFMSHPNLIKLYDFFSDENNVYLLLELGCDGNLYSLLKKHGRFSEETTSIVVRQICEGINYMHSQSIIHRDIKLQNIVFIHGMAKICDYGWSVHCIKDYRSTLCGTPLYLSPQILKGKLYNEKIDIWAIGALTHELVTQTNPFMIQTKQDLSKIVTDDFEMKAGSPQLKSFITFILRKNPSKRPDSDTILRHPFLKKYKDLETSQQLCKLIYKDF